MDKALGFRAALLVKGETIYAPPFLAKRNYSEEEVGVYILEAM